MLVRLLQTAPPRRRFAHSNDARHAFRLVRAMHCCARCRGGNTAAPRFSLAYNSTSVLKSHLVPQEDWGATKKQGRWLSIFCPASLTRVRPIEAAGHGRRTFKFKTLLSQGADPGSGRAPGAAQRPRGGARRSCAARPKQEDIATGPAARRPGGGRGPRRRPREWATRRTTGGRSSSASCWP